MTPAQTQKSYIEHVVRFARHFDRSPEHLGPDDIRSWLLHLARDKHLAPSTMGVAVAALRFCYTVTLGRSRAQRLVRSAAKRKTLFIRLSRHARPYTKRPVRTPALPCLSNFQAQAAPPAPEKSNCG
jgi:hypothetical protein